MGIVVGIKTKEGVVIGGDRQGETDGTVTSESVQKVFGFDNVGLAVTGEPGDIQEFQRQFERQLRTLQIEGEGTIGMTKLAAIAGREAKHADVHAVVAAPDSSGMPMVQEVGPDGHNLETTPVALGSGAEIALGQLDKVDGDASIAQIESNVSDILKIVRSRDPQSGGDIDIWSLPNPEGSNTPHTGT